MRCLNDVGRGPTAAIRFRQGDKMAVVINNIGNCLSVWSDARQGDEPPVVFDKSKPKEPLFSMLEDEILRTSKADRWLTDSNISHCLERTGISFKSLKINAVTSQ